MLTYRGEVEYLDSARLLKHPPSEVAHFCVTLLGMVRHLEDTDDFQHEECRRKIKSLEKQCGELNEKLRKSRSIDDENTGTSTRILVSSLKKTIEEKDIAVKTFRALQRLDKEQISKDGIRMKELERQLDELNKNYEKLDNKYQKAKQLCRKSDQSEESLIPEGRHVRFSLPCRPSPSQIPVQLFQDQSTQWELPIIVQIKPDIVQEQQQDVLDSWDKYSKIFNLDRKTIKFARADIVNALIEVTDVGKDLHVDRFVLIKSIMNHREKYTDYYRKQVSAVISELLSSGVPSDNIIRGLGLKEII